MAARTTKTSKTRPNTTGTTSSVANVATSAKPAPARKTALAGRTRSSAGTAGQSTRKPRTPAAGKSPTIAKADEILSKAEATIAAAIESLNTQMNAAVATLTELAVAHRGPREAVERPLPLDRATTTFQRLVAEVVDEQLGGFLPPIVALRNDLAARLGDSESAAGVPQEWRDFITGSVDALDQALSQAGVVRYDPNPGVPFDPLIHLAVGETHRADLPDGVVAEPLQPGFRTARGKVVSLARVKVNRR